MNEEQEQEFTKMCEAMGEFTTTFILKNDMKMGLVLMNVFSAAIGDDVTPRALVGSMTTAFGAIEFAIDHIKSGNRFLEPNKHTPAVKSFLDQLSTYYLPTSGVALFVFEDENGEDQLAIHTTGNKFQNLCLLRELQHTIMFDSREEYGGGGGEDPDESSDP